MAKPKIKLPPLNVNATVDYLAENPDVNLAPSSKGWLGDQIDTYKIGVYGMVYDRLEQLNARFDPEFDPAQNIPKGYESFADDLLSAGSKEEMDIMIGNINETLDIKRRQSEFSGLYTFGLNLVAGIVDPVNLINPSLGGLGFAKGALKGAAVYGGINAAQELVRNYYDPTSTLEETAINIGAGFILSGLVGGAAGKWGRAADDLEFRYTDNRDVNYNARYSDYEIRNAGSADFNAEIRSVNDNLASGKYADLGAVGRGFDNSINILDDLVNVESFDFGGSDVKIVFGPTNKFREDGSYVPAFFRRAGDVQAATEKAAVNATDEVGPGGRFNIIEDGAPGAARSFDGEGFEVLGATEHKAPGVKPDGTPEDVIYLDDAFILEQFDQKPWANPKVEGVIPFAEDAFQTPAEWLNFVVRHELHHKTTKKLEGETKADYENRINQLAAEDIAAGRTPLTPTRGILSDILLAPTPQGEAIRIAPDVVYFHDLLQGLSGDMATLTAANKLGRATTPGGSVYQKIHKNWLSANAELRSAINKAWLEYVSGSALGSEARVGINTALANLPMVGRAARSGKLRLHEFQQYVGKAIYEERPFELVGKPITDAERALIDKAATKAREIFRRFGDEAERLGIFDAQNKLKLDIQNHKMAIKSLEDFLAKNGDAYVAKSDLDSLRSNLADLETTLTDLQSKPFKPAKEKYYFPRLYDLEKIKKNQDAFTRLIAQSFGDDPDAEMLAEEWVRSLISKGGSDFIPNTDGPVNLLSRQIKLTNSELSDWIVNDVEIVLGVYSRRMGATIETVKAYGDRTMWKQIQDVQLAMLEKGYKPSKIKDAITLIESQRDRVLGEFHAKDPMSWDNRVARAIKNYGNLTLLPKAIYSQTTDVFRSLALNGYRPVFQAFKAAMDKQFSAIQFSNYGPEAGEALELVNARWSNAMIENDSAMFVGSQTLLERGLARAQAPFFKFNLMNPFTVIWKDFSAIMGAHTLMKESIQIASLIRSGKTIADFSSAEKRIMARLASFGISPRDAQILADMPHEKTNTGLILMNMDNWAGQTGKRAREIFTGALNGNIRTAVVTPGPLQRPAIMDGVFTIGGKRFEQPLLSLPFQLLSFALSSSAKVSHSILSGRERSRVVTLTSLFVGGMIATYAANRKHFDKMSWEQFALESMERSSIFGYLTDVYRRAEDLTGFGPRAALGIEDYNAESMTNEVGAIAGGALSVLTGAVEAFTNEDLTDKRRANLIRRAIPFAGANVWSDLLETWADWLDIDQKPNTTFDNVEYDLSHMTGDMVNSTADDGAEAPADQDEFDKLMQ